MSLPAAWPTLILPGIQTRSWAFHPACRGFAPKRTLTWLATGRASSEITPSNGALTDDLTKTTCCRLRPQSTRPILLPYWADRIEPSAMPVRADMRAGAAFRFRQCLCQLLARSAQRILVRFARNLPYRATEDIVHLPTR